jgi:hypothetical protein
MNRYTSSWEKDGGFLLSPNWSGTYFIVDDDNDDDDLCAPETFVITLREEIMLNVSENEMLKRKYQLNTYIITENLRKCIMIKSFTINAVYLLLLLAQWHQGLYG